MSQRRSLRVLTALVGALALTATSAFAAGIEDPIPAPIPPAGVDIALETVASGLVSPVAAARAPGDGHHLFIADQNGMDPVTEIRMSGLGVAVHLGWRHGESRECSWEW